jgi:hypothetical protein
MKLNRNNTQHNNSNTVQQFGQAKLVQNLSGRHELIGGSAADRAAVMEWVSLFAHEIVVSEPEIRPRTSCRENRAAGVKRFCW